MLPKGAKVLFQSKVTLLKDDLGHLAVPCCQSARAQTYTNPLVWMHPPLRAGQGIHVIRVPFLFGSSVVTYCFGPLRIGFYLFPARTQTSGVVFSEGLFAHQNESIISDFQYWLPIVSTECQPLINKLPFCVGIPCSRGPDECLGRLTWRT